MAHASYLMLAPHGSFNSKALMLPCTTRRQQLYKVS